MYFVLALASQTGSKRQRERERENLSNNQDPRIWSMPAWVIGDQLLEPSSLPCKTCFSMTIKSQSWVLSLDTLIWEEGNIFNVLTIRLMHAALYNFKWKMLLWRICKLQSHLTPMSMLLSAFSPNIWFSPFFKVFLGILHKFCPAFQFPISLVFII